MLRVTVDRDRCSGHGRCYALAPEVFSPDDEGYCEIPSELVGPELEAAARNGAANCPEQAITVQSA